VAGKDLERIAILSFLQHLELPRGQLDRMLEYMATYGFVLYAVVSGISIFSSHPSFYSLLLRPCLRPEQDVFSSKSAAFPSGSCIWDSNA